jgi:hypothetical protein
MAQFKQMLRPNGPIVQYAIPSSRDRLPLPVA